MPSSESFRRPGGAGPETVRNSAAHAFPPASPPCPPSESAPPLIAVFTLPPAGLPPVRMPPDEFCSPPLWVLPPEAFGAREPPLSAQDRTVHVVTKLNMRLRHAPFFNFPVGTVGIVPVPCWAASREPQPAATDMSGKVSATHYSAWDGNLAGTGRKRASYAGTTLLFDFSNHSCGRRSLGFSLSVISRRLRP